LTSNKKCAILYTRNQEPNSSLGGEAERRRKERHTGAGVQSVRRWFCIVGRRLHTSDRCFCSKAEDKRF